MGEGCYNTHDLGYFPSLFHRRKGSGSMLPVDFLTEKELALFCGHGVSESDILAALHMDFNTNGDFGDVWLVLDSGRKMLCRADLTLDKYDEYSLDTLVAPYVDNYNTSNALLAFRVKVPVAFVDEDNPDYDDRCGKSLGDSVTEVVGYCTNACKQKLFAFVHIWEKLVRGEIVREAIIMLEVEGYVEVRKGSGIHVVSNQPRHQQAADNNMEFANYGPFELLQARQLIESNIAEFAATQVTKQDIMKLMAIQEQARGEQCFRDSEWDLQFHIQVALATQNSALAAIVEKMWTQRSHNPYWKKLHEHIDSRTVDNWCDDHDQILKALIRKDPHAAKLAMWQHLENTKIMLFNETSDDFEFNADRYLFAENPVVHLDTATSGSK